MLFQGILIVVDVHPTETIGGIVTNLPQAETLDQPALGTLGQKPFHPAHCFIDVVITGDGIFRQIGENAPKGEDHRGQANLKTLPKNSADTTGNANMGNEQHFFFISS